MEACLITKTKGDGVGTEVRCKMRHNKWLTITRCTQPDSAFSQRTAANAFLGAYSHRFAVQNNCHRTHEIFNQRCTPLKQYRGPAKFRPTPTTTSCKG